MECDAARERAGTVAGAREGTRGRDDRPVHTLRTRSPAPLVVTVAVTAVVSALAAVEVTGSLVGRPLSGGALTRFYAHGSGAPWASSAPMLASAVLAAVGLTLVVVSLAPGRDDGTTGLSDEGTRSGGGPARPGVDGGRADRTGAAPERASGRSGEGPGGSGTAG